MLLTLLLAGAVAIDVPPDALGERLIVYLLDEELVLLPRGQPAGTELTIEIGDDRWIARASGQRTASLEVDADPRAVAELEILHRAFIALERAGDSGRATAVPVVQVVASSTLSPAQRGRLGLAVLDAGFGVTGREAEASLVLQVDARAGEALVVCAVRRAPRSPCAAPAVSLSPGEDWSGLLRHALRDALVAGLPASFGPPSRLTLDVSAGAAMILRSAAADPALQIDATLAAGPAVGRRWGLRAGFRLIAASAAPVSVQEVVALVGPSLSLPVRPDLSLTLSASGGLLVHAYDLVDRDSGAHADLTTEASIELGYHWVAGLALSLAVQPGLSLRDREHVRNGELLWSRGAARLGLSIALHYEPLEPGNYPDPRR